jgi:hypothetical protein
VRAQELPHNTEGLPLFTFAEGPSVPAGSQFRGVTPSAGVSWLCCSTGQQQGRKAAATA